MLVAWDQEDIGPVLTFRNGSFVFDNPLFSTREKLKRDPYWTCAGKGQYETKSLRAAVPFRRHSDAELERIFTRLFQAHYDLPRLPSLPFLDAHQQIGLRWILKRKRSYLAHAPGAGKTFQAILAAIYAIAEGQTLFIVPPSLTVNWEREIRKVCDLVGVWPSIGIVPLSAKKDDMAWRADFIICPDSMLTKPWVYERLRKMRKKLIGVDEASRFKEPTADRSLAFYGGSCGDTDFPGLYRDARHVVFLDGSPMPNRPIELWAPTYALHPEAIGCMDHNDFGYRYCGAKPNERGQWEFNHSSNEEELKAFLQKDFLHVVTEEQLSHPERRRSLLFTNQTNVRSPDYLSWERRHLTTLLKDIEELGEEACRGEVVKMRRELGVKKIPWVAAYTGERLREKNEAILLFAWHRDVCEGLAEKLSKWNPGVVMGGTSSTTREREFDLFQRGKKNLLVMNIVAGGRGHNLQRANRALFAEYSWTDEINKQCEKRASRRGSGHPFIRCEYAVAPGTLDEPVLSSVFTKQKRVRRIIG